MKLFLINFLVVLLPWKIRRIVLIRFYGYKIHKSSRIGFSYVFPRCLELGLNSNIGHLNVVKSLTCLSLSESAMIGNLNWISGFPENIESMHFSDQIKRSPKLLIGKHSAVTNRHLIDCTDTVTIGCFSTFAGFRSQILTHSISIVDSRQRSGPVFIGDYTFTGTGSIILPNSFLPNFSVLGAGSVLNKKYKEEYWLYAGNPARPVKQLEADAAYFNRETGYVI